MRRELKRFGILLAVLVGCGALAVGLRRAYVPPILMYHSVYPDAPYANRLAVSTQTFERQMAFLRRHRYNVIPLSQLAALVREGRRLPLGTVAITFDDGYKDNFTYAFAVLKKYAIPATVFIIVQEVGRPQGDRLSWEEITQMRDSGLVEFGSHTIGPEPLINITDAREVRRQIFESKEMLQGRLGVPVRLFSYPEGRYTAAIRLLVKEAGYEAAVATNPGRGAANDDIFALKRLRISENAKNLFVFWFESSGWYSFFKERRHK